jgi:hypothetical protein
VGDLWSPIQRSLAGWLLRLPPEQWTALRSGRSFTYSSDPRRGELSLPPDVLRVFRTSRPMLAPWGGSEQEERRREAEQARQRLWSEAEQYRVTVRFGSDPPAPVRMRLQVAARPFAGDGRSLYPDPRNRYEGFTLGAWGGSVVATAVEDAGRRAALEQDPVLSVKKPFQLDSRQYADLRFPGAPRRARFLAEFLPEVARAYGVNFIADTYGYEIRPFGGETSLRPPLVPLADPAPLFEVLDRLAGYFHAWDRRGSLVRIRYRNWFLARPTEIPLRHVRRWLAVTDRLGALPLAEFASAVGTMTDYQIPLLGDRWAYPPPLDDLRIGHRADLGPLSPLMRLYAQLPPTQQQALWDGRPLALARLSPALRPLVLEALDRIARTDYAGIDLEQWEGDTSASPESPTSASASGVGKRTFLLASEPAPRATTPPNAVTRFPVTHLEMRINYGPQKSHALRLIVAGRSVSLVASARLQIVPAAGASHAWMTGWSYNSCAR